MAGCWVGMLPLFSSGAAVAFPVDGPPPPPMSARFPVLLEECSDDQLDPRWSFEDGVRDDRPFMQSSRWRANIDTSEGVCRIHHRYEGRLGKPWTSGHAWSRQEFIYGYFEARLKFVESGGVDNAFWLMSQNRRDEVNSVNCEIDVVEGSHPSLATNNLHIGSPLGKREFQRQEPHPGVDAEGFSTYAVWWSAQFIRWYWNGILVREMPNPGCHHPMAVRFSTAVIGGYWGPIDRSLDGRWTAIDFVRVYRVESSPPPK